jgi:putative SOS response-associated peptidase YedK
MCGRIVLKAPARQVAQEFELAEEPVLTPRFNIAPGQKIAVVRIQAGQGRVCELLRWGLIPSWATHPREGDRLFNARSETVAVKPAFRDAFAARRCLVVADGFYEWRRHPAPKQPFYFSGTDGCLLALAGLWSLWSGPDGMAHETCTVLTTAANGLMRPIHDRMPVILSGDQRERWLAAWPTVGAAREAGGLPVPAAEKALRMWPVSHRVNRVGSEGPELCAALKHEPPEQLDLF